MSLAPMEEAVHAALREAVSLAETLAADVARLRADNERLRVRAEHGEHQSRLQRDRARAAEAKNERLRQALGAYRSALRSGEPESDQLRAVGDAALAAAPEEATDGD